MKALLIIILLLFNSALGQNKIDKDRQAIKAMCGCFEVTFNFAETFYHLQDTNYTPSPVKTSKGLEWAELVEDKEDKVSIQHLLIVGSEQNQQVVKHWRQDWLYQNQDIYLYRANNLWSYKKLTYKDVLGQWTQKVYQVDDSPRYEGTATWVHVDGKSYWENTTPAPLPRREFSMRADYNVLMRTNRHQITGYGWLHEQDNTKMWVKNNSKIAIADEKGLNTYIKVDDEKCKVAQDWWVKNSQYWKRVREQWSVVFAKEKDLSLLSNLNEKPLFEYLFELQEKNANAEEIKKVIASFSK